MNFNKYKFGYLFTLGAVFLNLILYWIGAYDSLEKNLYDYRLRLRGPLSGDYINENSDKYNNINNKAVKDDYVTDNDIIIIGLDQISYQSIGTSYPYNRGIIWSKAVDNLVSAGISVIVFDIMFDTRTIEDSLFSESIKRAEEKGVDIILASKNTFNKEIENQNFNLTKPSYDIINGTNAKLGLVGVISDKDGFIRRYITTDTTITDDYQKKYYSLAVQAVSSFINKEPKISSEGITVGDRYIPHYNDENTFLLNYFGPNSYSYTNQTFRTISLYEVLDDCDRYDDGVDYDEDGIADCNSVLDGLPIIWDYKGKQGKDTIYASGSMNDFTDRFFLERWIKEGGVDLYTGKIAIIGSALEEHHDIFNTPFDSFNNAGPMYGVELHAHAIQQILDNNHIRPILKSEGGNTYFSEKLLSLIINFCLALLVFFLITYFGPIISAGLSLFIILLWLDFSIGIFLNDYLWLFKSRASINVPDINQSIVLPVIYPISSIVFSYIFNLSYKLYTENQDKKFLKNTFGNYISSDLVDQMYESKTIPELGGLEGYHTLIFSDVASFSSFSEKLSATELVELLNEYLTEMTKIIINNGGTVDKYIGDAIMAFYGAPLEVKNHEYQAVLSVIQMNQKLKELRKKWASEGDKWPELVKNMQHRVGINTGNLVTGNMGSELQMNYTCMGDVVNLGARLESGAKHWGIDAQVSGTVYKATKNDFVYRKLGNIRVKGKEEAVDVYELICEKGQEPKGLEKLLEIFDSARKLYLNQKWDEAISLFEKCEKLEGMSDLRYTNPSQTYIKICNEFKENSPGSNWDGIYNFKEK